MHFSVVATVLLSAVLVQAAEHVVKVGENGTLTFDPTDIQAVAGDIVTFQFQAKNHSVTQSSFPKPCTKSGTIDSGFEFVAANTAEADLPVFQVTVNDTNPLWFYCAQTIPAVHCQQGMVFAINAPADKSFSSFQDAAKATAGAASNSSTTTTGSNSTTTTGSNSTTTTGGTNSTTGSGNSTTGNGGDDGNNDDGNNSGALKLNIGAAGAFTVAALLSAFL